MEAIERIGRLHQIKASRERIEAELAQTTAPLREQLELLAKEEEEIRVALEQEAADGNGKLSFPGLGSVSVKESESLDITDAEEALAIVKENPAFVDAQKIGVNKAEFLKIAKELETMTGTLVSCVARVNKRRTTIKLAKMEDEDREQASA